MNKCCDICGKTIKRNSIVSDIRLQHAKYDGSCYHWTKDISCMDICYWKICNTCTDKIASFLKELTEAENE